MAMTVGMYWVLSLEEKAAPMANPSKKLWINEDKRLR